MKRLVALVFAAALAAAPVAAQDGLLRSCRDAPIVYAPVGDLADIEPEVRYLCGEVAAVLTGIQPALGIASAAGNPVAGTATTIGRRMGSAPRISITARVNGSSQDLPDLLNGFDARIGSDGRMPALGSQRTFVGSVQGDLAVGLFNGFALGPAAGGLGAVDFLGSVALVPRVDDLGMGGSALTWGAGARVGIARQGLVTPGASISAMYRHTGDISFGDTGRGDPAELTADLSTISLRAEVSKGIGALALAAGAGYDIYRSDVRFDFLATCPATVCTAETTARPAAPIAGTLRTGAWNIHGNAGFTLVVLNIVAELGYHHATGTVTDEDLRGAGLPDRAPTAEDLGSGRFFGGIGIRLTI